jgi:exodeoxyribonuclease VII large subunit
MNEVLTVTQFLNVLNETLGFTFPEVVVQGEVSSFKTNQGKWVFFDVKDEESTLGCFMTLYQLKVPLEDGMKVRVIGTPKLTKWGKFSFTVKRVELAGEGALKQAFLLLQKKLGAEGLFAVERKRQLPIYPKSIGLVASEQSAAYADFIKIINQRWGGLDIKLIDVQVQGAAAPDQVVGAIRQFNESADPVDVLVIIRGGGSMEDLQAFNTEDVARAVAGSRIPTIVGVGHEVDVSLADMAADVRAATPTDAARIVVPDRHAVMTELDGKLARIEQHIQQNILRRGQLLLSHVTRMERFVRQPIERLARAAINLRRDLGTIERTLQLRQQKLDGLVRNLKNVDPKAVLARGYSVVRQNDKLITSAHDLNPDRSFMIQFASDQATATLEK